MTKSAPKLNRNNRIGNTRIIPITRRIIIIFIISILVTSFASNFINLAFNRAELIKMMQELLVKDLKDVYDFINSQYEIYQFSQNHPDAFNLTVKLLESNAARQLKNEKSVTMGLLINDERRGLIVFQASKIPRLDVFDDQTALRRILQQEAKGIREGALTFDIRGEEYYGVYKYFPKWNTYLIRAEEMKEFSRSSRRIFRNVAFIIGFITLACALIGTYYIRHITRFIDGITNAIMKMIETQQMETIDLEGATNDNITFMGMAFNSLSSSINNLLSIFRRFVNQDVAAQAYQEKMVRLEGTQKELAILCSDIKSFTTMTETLGTDIINILNLFYQRAIRAIFQRNGLIGSIMGDAVLAVFGVEIGESKESANKSYQAVWAGYDIQKAARTLRMEMKKRRDDIIKLKGALTEAEELIYQAVLVEVGVGIDGGTVFYGNIGSYERMTNTVIGDNVNFASRLEGLTRIYKVPIICSEYIKDDIEQNLAEKYFYFLELDTVQVKGKTSSKKIYWPIPLKALDESLKADLIKFEESLALYYKGNWQEARECFKELRLPMVEEFLNRTRSGQAPDNWNGTWTIGSK
jgi:class 3 adenylate cyclase